MVIADGVAAAKRPHFQNIYRLWFRAAEQGLLAGHHGDVRRRRRQLIVGEVAQVAETLALWTHTLRGQL